ncbi:MAG: transaldolase [Chloroflexi bacterium]|jgi:transaldolase|nr:MAG: transaldolase [Chloroflexota bacterium]
MTLFLDSASVEDASRAAQLGFVSGITTNPGLIARVLGEKARGRTPMQNTLEAVTALCDVFPGVVMAQLTASTPEGREEEARVYIKSRPGQVGLKIPSLPENFALARRFAVEGIRVGMTTIFSPGQVYLACEAGAAIVFPYVNRSTRLLGDGFAIVRQMRAVVDALGSPAQILAASIKTPQEAVDTILAGAHGLTLPLELMLSLGQHPLSDQSIDEFNQNWS